MPDEINRRAANIDLAFPDSLSVMVAHTERTFSVALIHIADKMNVLAWFPEHAVPAELASATFVEILSLMSVIILLNEDDDAALLGMYLINRWYAGESLEIPNHKTVTTDIDLTKISLFNADAATPDKAFSRFPGQPLPEDEINDREQSMAMIRESALHIAPSLILDLIRLDLQDLLGSN